MCDNNELSHFVGLAAHYFFTLAGFIFLYFAMLQIWLQTIMTIALWRNMHTLLNYSVAPKKQCTKAKWQIFAERISDWRREKQRNGPEEICSLGQGWAMIILHVPPLDNGDRWLWQHPWSTLPHAWFQRVWSIPSPMRINVSKLHGPKTDSLARDRTSRFIYVHNNISLYISLVIHLTNKNLL